MAKNKAQLGQFFTTNADAVLRGFEPFVAGKAVTDPFAGNGDLLRWAKKNGAKSVKGYDIDPACIDNKTVFENDSLKTPQAYDFVVTNPPYLYQNKMADNSLLTRSKHTDLYQLALEKLTNSRAGIVIVPINFLSAQNARYIRRTFFERFAVKRAVYFTQQVFADTTYNVIALYYEKKPAKTDSLAFDLIIEPQGNLLPVSLQKQFDWQIGGEFLSAVNSTPNRLKIGRIEQSDVTAGSIETHIALNHSDNRQTAFVSPETAELFARNIVVLKAIDTGTESGKIRLEDRRTCGIDALISLKTSRNQIELLFPESVSVAEQERLITAFNTVLNKARERYFSLFMTNFRDHDRKRVSFGFVYRLLNALYFSKINGYAE